MSLHSDNIQPPGRCDNYHESKFRNDWPQSAMLGWLGRGIAMGCPRVSGSRHGFPWGIGDERSLARGRAAAACACGSGRRSYVPRRRAVAGVVPLRVLGRRYGQGAGAVPVDDASLL
ncbi:hypothetical protein [Lysobacter gummosus]|uniref:hypothetical protein n=1 Tax=Lysobacter gummosus TaxID=262324 RepID=UPI0036292913